jgi:hypothetical protein
MTCLNIQNPELNTTDWSIMSHKLIEKKQTLALSIDPRAPRLLAQHNIHKGEGRRSAVCEVIIVNTACSKQTNSWLSMYSQKI